MIKIQDLTQETGNNLRNKLLEDAFFLRCMASSKKLTKEVKEAQSIMYLLQQNNYRNVFVIVGAHFEEVSVWITKNLKKHSCSIYRFPYNGVALLEFKRNIDAVAFKLTHM